MKRNFKFIILIIVVMTIAACSNNTKEETSNVSSKETSSNTLNIVTSFYPMYDFTKNIVGDKANVSMLIDDGVEPHDYEPSAKDMAKIQDADVFVYNSNAMETWVEKVLKNIDTSKVKVIEASKGITLLETTEEDHEEQVDDSNDKKETIHNQAYDPHVWLDPVLAKKEVGTISEGIIDINKENADYFAKNTANYTKKLDKLNESYESGLKNAVNRKFVTQHNAFSYLAKQYDLEEIPISGISPDQEPTAKELKNIEDFVKENKINIIFTESSASPKIAKTISDATGATLEVLNPLENLSKVERDKGEDYISVMEQNLTELEKAVN